jgi:hypothetical protein
LIKNFVVERERDLYSRDRKVDSALTMPSGIIAFLISLTELFAGKKVLAAPEVTTHEVTNQLHGVALGDLNTPGKKRKKGSKRIAQALSCQHSTTVQSQEQAIVLLDLPAYLVDDPHRRQRRRAYGHMTERAGSSLLVTEMGARNDWRVEPTMFELHTPQLEKREVSSSHFSPNMFNI